MDMNAELERDDGSESGEPSIAGSSAASVYCNLERDYAKLLNEMKSNEALATYEAEYTRLYESFYQCRQEEAELMEKLRQLQEDLINKTNRINELEKTIETQTRIIAKLNQDIVDTSKLANSAHIREQNSQEVIQNLRLTIAKLSQEVEHQNKQLVMDEKGTESKQKESSMKERERMVNEIETLKEKIKSITIYNKELEKKMNEVDDQLNKMQENMAIQMNEISKERLMRNQVENELLELEEELKLKNTQLQSANAVAKTTTNTLNRVENSLREQKNTNDKLRKEVNKLSVDRMNLQSELDNASKQVSEMEKVLREKSKDYKLLVQEAKRLKEELSKCKAENDWTANKYARIDKAQVQMEKDLEYARHALKNAEIKIGAHQRQIAEEKKSAECAIREKNNILKMVDSLKNHVNKTEQTLFISEQSKRKIELELEEMKQINVAANSKVVAFEKEKNKFCEQIHELKLQVDDFADKIRIKEIETFNYTKELTEFKNKFQQQQNLLESTRAERNTCYKNFIAAKNEVNELRNTLAVMNNQLEKLKDEVATKQSNIMKKEFWLKKVQKEKDTASLKLQSAQKNIVELRQIIEDADKEQKQLWKNIKVSDLEVNRYKKDINNIMNERDVLGTQLVRRNDELNLQHSKIKVLQETLQKGESEFMKKFQDIRLLKLEINKLYSEKALLTKNLNNMSNFRHEIFQLNRDLTRERLKVMALEDELQNPLNIHRWRKLEDSNPDTLHLLKKTKLLQKRILKMNSNLLAKNRRIQEMEKLCMNLRQLFLKQPGPELTTKLIKTKKILQCKDNKLKCLTAELNMWEYRTSEYKFELEKMTKEMCEIKIKYYDLKQKNPTSSKKSLETRSSALPSHKKFSGGGFTMLVAPSQKY
ncbi:cilia- and flagella-associated protein 58-like [Chelonus insularis]|uniref:cilia- and flagella-associated protein 58-like n=1 Tax=Chelonus insularis TaxID=460826 RepID=UPI00158A2E0C|nr:cilia- and flagella-associated protein 58-like [Chelonus insularis]